MALEQTNGYSSGEDFARKVAAALEASPIDTRVQQPLSYYLYFPDRASALEAERRLACAAQLDGAELRVEEPLDDGQWLLLVHQTILPSLENLQPVGELLFAAAVDFGGDLDGWETDIRKIPGGLDDMKERLTSMLQEKLGTLGLKRE